MLWYWLTGWMGGGGLSLVFSAFWGIFALAGGFGGLRLAKGEASLRSLEGICFPGLLNLRMPLGQSGLMPTKGSGPGFLCFLGDFFGMLTVVGM